MKKIIILTTMIMLLGVTGCNKEEVNEANADVNIGTEIADSNAEVEYSEEEFYENVRFEIESLKEDFENGEITEEFMNEAIEMMESLEYDSAYVHGFDEGALMMDYMKLMRKHGMIPEEFNDMTDVELYALIRLANM